MADKGECNNCKYIRRDWSDKFFNAYICGNEKSEEYGSRIEPKDGCQEWVTWTD